MNLLNAYIVMRSLHEVLKMKASVVVHVCLSVCFSCFVTEISQ